MIRRATLAVLAAVVAAVFVVMLVPDIEPPTAPANRCPEDAVRLAYAPDDAGACIAADDFAPGTVLRATADALLARCPVGTGRVEFGEHITGACR